VAHARAAAQRVAAAELSAVWAAAEAGLLSDAARLGADGARLLRRHYARLRPAIQEGGEAAPYAGELLDRIVGSELAAAEPIGLAAAASTVHTGGSGLAGSTVHTGGSGLGGSVHTGGSGLAGSTVHTGGSGLAASTVHTGGSVAGGCVATQGSTKVLGGDDVDSFDSEEEEEAEEEEEEEAVPIRRVMGVGGAVDTRVGIAARAQPPGTFATQSVPSTGRAGQTAPQGGDSTRARAGGAVNPRPGGGGEGEGGEAGEGAAGGSGDAGGGMAGGVDSDDESEEGEVGVQIRRVRFEEDETARCLDVV